MYCATKILVIGECGDDQQAQRTAISNAEPGWQLDFCESGHAALDQVRLLQPHCIVLDNQIPDMSALEVFRAIRNQPGNSMPVLMLASHDNKWSEAEALNLGVQDYLFKDARGNYLALLPAVLKKAVREHRVALERRSAQDALSDLWRKFEHLFLDLTDGIVLLNDQRAIESINPAACRIFGYEAHALYGRPLRMLLHPSERERYDHELDAFSGSAGGGAVGQRVREVRALNKVGAVLTLNARIAEIGFDGRRYFACVVREASPGIAASSRAALEAALGRAIRSARGGHHTHILLHLRLGRFDETARACGRGAGAQLSRQVSKLLAQQTRRSDRLGRLGGGEFALLLEECLLERAVEVAGKMVEAVRAFRFEWGGKRFALDLGIGLTAVDGRSVDAGSVLAAARRACDQAVRCGRYGIQIAGDLKGSGRNAGAQSEWLPRLRNAIDGDDFRLFFQRVFALAHEGVGSHFEVLLRYMDQEGGVHLPQDFIPSAEQYGLLAAIDCWVLRRLLQDPPTEMLAEQPGSFLSINLSGAALADPDFQGFALRELRRSKLAPDRLCFEISEANAIENLPQVMRFIKTLKELGYRFALDDFDGGLSSFSHLTSLPVDYLKVCGDVAPDTAGHSAYFATVESVHRIAESMGIATVAKSVESEEALCRLRTMGVEFAQGFGLHAPEPLFRAAAG